MEYQLLTVCIEDGEQMLLVLDAHGGGGGDLLKQQQGRVSVFLRFLGAVTRDRLPGRDELFFRDVAIA